MHLIIEHYYIQKKTHSICPLWKWAEMSEGRPSALYPL